MPDVNFRVRAAGKKTAEIYVYDVIGEDWFGGISAKSFSKALAEAGDIDTIKLRVNSPGGDVFDGLAIYNTLVRHKARVEADIDGEAASIASIIVMAADEIRIADNAMMMIHNPWSFAVGTADDMRDKAALLDQVAGNLARTYAARTGQSDEAIRAWMDAETWFDAQAARDAGLVDKITEPQRAAASIRTDLPWIKMHPHARKAAASGHADSARSAMVSAKIGDMGRRLRAIA